MIRLEPEGLYWDNGKENGNYYEYGMLGLSWDNGKYNGNSEDLSPKVSFPEIRKALGFKVKV